MSLNGVLENLEALVACDTQNPPRRIDGDSPVFRLCADLAGTGFQTRIWDHGEGHVSWYAVRGNPRVLFNVHLDTVPNGEGWTTDPLSLQVRDGLAYGRGSCDIKGAAAVLLNLAGQGAQDLALLFTSDEEGAGGCCVEKFIASSEAERYQQVIVAEPTSCRAVLGHRGFLSVKTRFHGIPGHSSETRALQENANHRMARWAAGALRLVERRKRTENDPGTCFNIGIIDGGTKSNVIAGSAFVHWSARLRPGESNEEFLHEIQRCDDVESVTEWEVPFSGDPLPASDYSDDSARAFCLQHGLMTGDPVDFWTEASLFSQAGLPAIVLGPGHISQAHMADEWVELEQLSTISAIYSKVVKHNA